MSHEERSLVTNAENAEGIHSVTSRQTGARRARLFAVAAVLALTLAATLAMTLLVAKQQRREAEADLQALATSLARSVDLILMDMRMPRLDGANAAARIRQGDGPSARARIIGVTGHQQPAIATMLSDLAFDDCLPKPLDFTCLGALLRGEAVAEVRPSADALFDPTTLADLRAIDGGGLDEPLGSGHPRGHPRRFARRSDCDAAVPDRGTASDGSSRQRFSRVTSQRIA